MPFDASFVHHLGKVAKLEKSFEQTTGLQAIESKLSKKVEGGYCFGACATWLTLALCKQAHTEIDPANAKLVRNMAKGAVKYDKARPRAAGLLRDAALSGSSDRYEQIEQQRQNEWDAAEDEAFAALEAAAQTWRDNFSTFSDHPVMKHQMDKVRKVLDDTERQTGIEIQAKKQAAQKLAQGKADRAAQSGGAVAVTPEQVLKVAWRILQKQEATKYTGALTPVKRIDGGQADTVGGFVCELIRAAAFTDGRGMIVNFTTGASTGTGGQASVLAPAGHAIALHRVDSENFWLFEPNLGAFRVTSRRKLIYALMLIMADGYDKRVLRDDDAIVFCKTSDSLPDQGGAAVDPGVLLDRDWAKKSIGLMLEVLATAAYDAGVDALKTRKEKGDDKEAVAKANGLLRDAFLHARLTQSNVKPSQVM
ncbi:MAG: hypothetical protein ABIX12_11695, partial [Rubrivivax sp.]